MLGDIWCYDISYISQKNFNEVQAKPLKKDRQNSRPYYVPKLQ
jgi:hypothetical protein